MKKRVLFVLHEATRSGAPILLLEIIKEIQLKKYYEVDLLILLNGSLAKDFSDIVPTTINIKYFHPLKNRMNRLLNNFTLNKKNITQEDLYNIATEQLAKKNYHCVFGMTVATIDILEKFKARGVKTILYTHELQFALESFYNPIELSHKILFLDYVLAGSQSVKDFLIQRFQLCEKNIDVAYSFISADIKIKTEASALKEYLGISEDTFILGTLSTQELRKGSDLIPQIAKNITQKSHDFKFKIINIGGNEENPFVRFSKIDAQKLLVEENIIFIENTTEPNDYINMFDCFLLPSREDPFPLVLHLAALFNKPIVGFKGSGGVEEFLSETDTLAGYLNIEEFTNIIIKISEDKIFREKSLAKIRENSNKFSKENSMKVIYNAINNM